MTVADVAPVMELERSLFPKDAWSEGMLRDELSHDSRYYLVAEDPAGPGIVGYAGLRSVPPEGDVQTIAVDPAWQGRGVGTLLLEGLLAEAAARASTEVFLEVRAENRRAKDLYTRFGFVQVGLRKGYYADEDAIVMCRSAPKPGDADGASG
nr:ribosomal protein S18-alanine N-acetyltransferase [Murinocardiopsis flavida]